MLPEAPEPAAVLAELLQRPAWHERAACAGVSIDLFVIGRGYTYEAIRPLCESCGVRQECLAVALANPDLTGMWGGTSDQEHKRMRRDRVA
jgi:WhiB family transcriptional regulator, redox-sensing transcriptional regulator